MSDELVANGIQQQNNQAYTQQEISPQISQPSSPPKSSNNTVIGVLGLIIVIFLCVGMIFYSVTKKDQSLTTAVPTETISAKQNSYVITPTTPLKPKPTPTSTSTPKSKLTTIPAQSADSNLLASQPYHNAQYNFSIYPPKGWTTKEGLGNIVVWFYAPSNHGTINIDISSLSAGTTFVQEMSQLKASYKVIFQGYTPVEDNSLTVNGHNAYALGGTFTLLSDPMRNKQLIVLSGTRAFTVTATENISYWNADQNMINASLMSIKVP